MNYDIVRAFLNEVVTQAERDSRQDHNSWRIGAELLHCVPDIAQQDPAIETLLTLGALVYTRSRKLNGEKRSW